MERLEFDLLFRGLSGFGVDDPVWDHSTFSKSRDRLLEGEVEQFLPDLRDRSVTPHIAIDEHLSKTDMPRKTAVDGRTTHHIGENIGQRCRKRIE